MLGVTHEALWLWAFDSPPRLGNLTGVLSPAAEQLVLRPLAFGSSVGSGLGVGALGGAVAWLVARAVPSFGHRETPRRGARRMHADVVADRPCATEPDTEPSDEWRERAVDVGLAAVVVVVGTAIAADLGSGTGRGRWPTRSRAGWAAWCSFAGAAKLAQNTVSRNPAESSRCSAPTFVCASGGGEPPNTASGQRHAQVRARKRMLRA
jgi:hypothetical protein